MERKRTEKSIWSSDPAYNLDLIHLEEIANLAGPGARICIETKDLKLDDIDELLKYVSAPTKLESLEIVFPSEGTFALSSTLWVIPSIRANGAKAKELESKVALVLESARVRFSVRGFAMLAAIWLTPILLIHFPEIAYRALRGGLSWDVPWSWPLVIVLTVLGLIAAAWQSSGTAGSRIDPQKRQAGFGHLNKDKIVMSVVTTVLGGVLTHLGLWLKGLW